MMVWDIRGDFKDSLTELVDNLRLKRSVTSIIALSFTDFRYFCVGYTSGEMSVFDSENLEIAEEV